MEWNTSTSYGEKDQNFTAKYDESFNFYYKLSQAANVLLIIITVWIIICMIVYIMRKKPRKRGHERLNGRNMYFMCLAAVILTLPRFVLEQVVFNAPSLPLVLEHCELVLDIVHATYLIAVALTYSFLWLRQRAIYAHPVVLEVTTKWMNWLSRLMILVILVSYITLYCLFSVPSVYTYNEKGCILKPIQPGSSTSRVVRYFVICACMILWQAMLLSLFVYPLIRIKCRAVPETSKKRNTINEAIRRSSICAAVAAVSDFIVGILTATVVPGHYPVVMSATLYDASLLINVFCILATFSYCGEVLLIFCSAPRRQAHASTRRL